jgi:choline kinase
MNLIVLAAGKGSRMGVFTADKPKPLLTIGGSTLLEQQFEAFRGSGMLDRVVYVVGYLAEAIEDKIAALHLEGVETVFNPFFDVSDNLISLWFARYYMDEDFVICNGDNLLDSEAIKRICSAGEGIHIAVNKKDDYDNDDMKVIVKDGAVARVSKLIDEREADFESVGLAAISGADARTAFRSTLDRLARSKDYRDKYWLEVFNVMARDGVRTHTSTIGGYWREFDFHSDVQRYLDERT